MDEAVRIEPIAHIYTDFPEKFGLPRQSGLIEGLEGKIVFEPKYRSAQALRELDGFSHIWLIWEFSECADGEFSATVRPPRLGGNKRVGVFASRSPFRPNSLGLSAVKIEKIELEGTDSPVIYVSGIDMMSGTPIFDIKPYVPVTDCIENAREGFTVETKEYEIEAVCDAALLEKLPADKREALIDVLRHDPRPSYKSNEIREYGMSFAGYEIKFEASDGKLTVKDIRKNNED